MPTQDMTRHEPPAVRRLLEALASPQSAYGCADASTIDFAQPVPTAQYSAVIGAVPFAGSSEAQGVTDDVRALCRGPGRLAQALEVDRTLDGVDLLRSSSLWLEAGRRVPTSGTTSTRRIGVTAGADTLWRWVETGSNWATPTPRC